MKSPSWRNRWTWGWRGGSFKWLLWRSSHGRKSPCSNKSDPNSNNSMNNWRAQRKKPTTNSSASSDPSTPKSLPSTRRSTKSKKNTRSGGRSVRSSWANSQVPKQFRKKQRHSMTSQSTTWVRAGTGWRNFKRPTPRWRNKSSNSSTG